MFAGTIASPSPRASCNGKTLLPSIIKHSSKYATPSSRTTLGRVHHLQSHQELIHNHNTALLAQKTAASIRHSHILPRWRVGWEEPRRMSLSVSMCLGGIVGGKKTLGGAYG